MPPINRRQFVTAAKVQAPAPRTDDICPVCGKLAATHPQWGATIVFSDDTASHFDGTKCHYKFLFDISRFDTKHRLGDVRVAAVTDYYNLGKLDTFAALYVVGSDVLGPMGHEVIPFASMADAEHFRRNHGGKLVPSAAAMDGTMLIGLDEGRF